MNNVEKVIILNDYATVQGGAAQVAVLSALTLSYKGIPVIYIYGTGGVDERLKKSNVICINLEQYDLLNNPSRFNSAVTGLWNFSVAKKLRQILTEHYTSGTIIHLHSWVKSLTPSALSVLSRGKYPTVVTLHDYFSACPNGAFYDYVSESICKKVPLSRKCLVKNCDSRSYLQKIWRSIRQFITKKSGMPTNFRYFIKVSDFSERIISNFLHESSILFDVPNPIEVSPSKNYDKLSVDRISVNSDVIYIGRLDKEKGVRLLLEAFRDTSGKSLRIVGTGALEDELKSELHEAKFEGWQNREGILSALSKSKVLVFTSMWYETQGLTVLEAASVGVPCVVSDACAARESVEDGKTGLWFKSGDSNDLKQKVQYLMDNPLIADDMGKSAYKKFWCSPPTSSAHADKLLETYERILDIIEEERR